VRAGEAGGYAAGVGLGLQGRQVFWPGPGQPGPATGLKSWIVFKPVTRAEWYGKYAKSTYCQGKATVCAKLKGCGSGDKGYVD
jgi:hypothetical protein